MFDEADAAEYAAVVVALKALVANPARQAPEDFKMDAGKTEELTEQLAASKLVAAAVAVASDEPSPDKSSSPVAGPASSSELSAAAGEVPPADTVDAMAAEAAHAIIELALVAPSSSLPPRLRLSRPPPPPLSLRSKTWWPPLCRPWRSRFQP